MSMKDPHADMRRKWAATHAARRAEPESTETELETKPESPFALLALPAVVEVGPKPERFENVPTKQRPLFIGANDEPGQTYLFGTGVEPGFAERLAGSDQAGGGI